MPRLSFWLGSPRKQLEELAQHTGNECLLMHVLTREVVERVAERQLETGMNRAVGRHEIKPGGAQNEQSAYYNAQGGGPVRVP